MGHTAPPPRASAGEMSKNLQSKSSIPARVQWGVGLPSKTLDLWKAFFLFNRVPVVCFLAAKKKWKKWKGHHLKSRHDKYRTCRRFDLHLDHNRYRSPIVVEDAWPIPMVGPSGASDIKKIQQNMGLGVSQITYSNPGCGQGQHFTSLFREGVFRFRVCFTPLS